jgi:hypothetical protein
MKDVADEGRVELREVDLERMGHRFEPVDYPEAALDRRFAHHQTHERHVEP